MLGALPQLAFGIQYLVGVDGISLFLIVLTGFLTPLALLSSWDSVHKNVKVFSFFMLGLETAMLGVFVSIDLFLFYIFWDAMLIPMYFLIGIWGYERRVYAAVKFILYTMGGSVLMLLAIIGLAWAYSNQFGSPSFSLLDVSRITQGKITRESKIKVTRAACRVIDASGAAINWLETPAGLVSDQSD